MHRFFASEEDIYKNEITIKGDDVSHISKVLRLKQEDIIEVCDGRGTDYEVRIEEIQKNLVRTTILGTRPSLSEATLKVVLFQSIPKSTKMDLIIQKCTEMGINTIVPVISTRTIVKLETEKDELKKVERWTKIAEEAAKQSKRGIIPIISMPISFDKAILEAAKLDMAIIPYELEAANSLKKTFDNNNAIQSIGIFIGPEGGLENVEVENAIKNNIIPVTLGPRILRTETAGFVALSCIMYHFDQMQMGRI